MAANVQQVQLRGSYQQIIDQDRGRLIHAFENDDADYIAVANTLGINIQHHVVLLPTTCVLVGAESWQRGAAKNERQGTI